ncbi:OmpA family protein [Marinobacter salicampi]|uniref:OmpA family protein n=1 Tax=Marinobacter salicampi TaxID=435907 RepID=UPI00140A05D3|nr:OmpA family protein [Marinobacter salicampi]
MNIMKGLVVRYLILVGAVIAPAAYATETGFALKLDQPGEQVRLEEKSFARHAMIAGPMDYRAATAAGEREGYIPETEIVTEGSLRREVLDFDRQTSAHALFQRAERAMTAAGYDIDYRCERAACGDAPGWTLFYPSQVDGRTDAQYYLFARFPAKGPAETYVALHVTDIGTRPRVAIDQVTVLSDNPEHIAAYGRLMETMIESDALAGPLVAFGFDSALLDDRSRLILRAAKQVLERNNQWTLDLVGHADDRGDLDYNLGLSQRRARAVHDFLIAEGIAGERLSVRGEGAATPVSTTTEQWRSAQRRVDLFRSDGLKGQAASQSELQTPAETGS